MKEIKLIKYSGATSELQTSLFKGDLNPEDGTLCFEDNSIEVYVVSKEEDKDAGI